VRAQFSKWRGYFVAAPTVFNHDLSIDAAGQDALLDWYLAEGMHGIVIAGTSGEWSALTSKERVRLFELARLRVPRSLPLIAGCNALTALETGEYARQAALLGFDGIMVSPPPYVVPTEEEVFAFYQMVADASDLPIIVYNWPRGTGIDMSPALVTRLGEIPKIVALKNSTANLGAFVETLRRCQDRLIIFGILPSDLGLGLMERLGGDGCIGAMGVLGRHQPGFFTHAWRGDSEQALRCGRKDQFLMSHLLEGFGGRYGNAIATFKYLLSMRGLPSGPVRPPLLNLSPGGQDAIQRIISSRGELFAP